MNSKFAKKASLALGVASVAASMGNVAVKAGPALQTLNNLTNTADFTINNTYGQSVSVDGVMLLALTPFKAGTATGLIAAFTANTATLTTGFLGSAFGGGAASGWGAVSQVKASVAAPVGVAPLTLNSTTIAAISLAGASATQTLGASISSTLFGPNNVRASASYTNQLINDLSAF